MPNLVRPRVPEYPRPVPALCLDEAPICHDTIVYEQWTEDAEEESRKRASKRRKQIQDAAESYLRDQPVFILSASLRGPFDDGWKNPWAKKRRRKDAEIPETTVKDARWRKSLLPSAINPDTSVVIDPTPARPLPPTRRVDESKNVFNARSHSAQAEDRPPHHSAKKVEDWLRKTDDRPAKRPIDIRSSPTPMVRPLFGETLMDNDINKPTSKRTALSYSRPPRVTTPALPSLSQSSEHAQESPRRAELAIIQAKRLSVYRVPQSTHLPEFEYRRPRSRGQKPPEADARQGGLAPAVGANNEPTNPNQYQHIDIDIATKQVPITSKTTTSDGVSKSRPGLSTETSKASTIQPHLPSAQVIPAPNLTAMPSNAHSTDEMLQSVPQVSSKEALTEAGPSERQIVQEAEKENRLGQQSREEASPEGMRAPAASLEKTPERELETQEMIAGIKPFDFSTIKKPVKVRVERTTPMTATKVIKTGEKKKQASFALSSPPSDGSQKSIKVGMRVTKGTKITGRSGLGKHSPRRLGFSSMDAHVETLSGGKGDRKEQGSMESLPSVSAMFDRKKTGAPKGILKSSMAASTGPIPTATNTASTSAKQDAQQVPGPGAIMGGAGMVDEDDGFDLDGAIDELGSYLGTWDADVEAGKLAI